MPDSTGRFGWRPYYDQEELDYECERLVTSFLKRKYGETRFPISTDDLSVMIEQETSYLDLYADLSVEGEDVEGLTEFYPNKKPSVKIARELSLDLLRYSRLRTTLAHEYGHVQFHTFLWELGPGKKSTPLWNLGKGKKSTPGILSKIHIQRRTYEQFRKRLASRYALQDSFPFPSNSAAPTFLTGYQPNAALKCKRSRIVDAPFSDWMEWQASYVSGAILMPLSPLRRVIRPDIGEGDSLNWLSSDSASAGELIAKVSTAFDVSPETARVRLEKLGFLQNTQSAHSVTRLSSTAPIT
ncbi:MAG: hypothetical protein AABZ77_01805 [Chloroflexota bacterium]